MKQFMIDFIIYHELGHIKSGHLEMLENSPAVITPGVSPAKLLSSLRFEYEADKYALDHSGLTKDQCIKTLKSAHNPSTYLEDFLRSQSLKASDLLEDDLKIIKATTNLSFEMTLNFRIKNLENSI
jgi:Zn-dependent protease with chaperone function